MPHLFYHILFIYNGIDTITHCYKDGWDSDVHTPLNWKMPTDSLSEFNIFGVWWKDEKTIWFCHNGTKVYEVNLKHHFDVNNIRISILNRMLDAVGR